MKNPFSFYLFFVFLFFSTEKSFCQVQIDSLFQTADSTFKTSIATVIIPKSKEIFVPGYKHGYYKKYSLIKFDIDVDGQPQSFQTDHYDVDEEIGDALYYDSKPGFKYVVKYNPANPAHCEVMIDRQVIEPDEKTDTTTAEITWIDEFDESFDYSYHVSALSPFSNSEGLTEKHSLYYDHPNVRKGNKFLAVYVVSAPERSIILLDHPVIDSSYVAHPGKNLVEVRPFPFYKIKVGYEFIASKHFTVGVDFCYYYPHSRADSSWVFGDGLALRMGNSFRVDPFLKWYPQKVKPISWYLKIFASRAYIENAEVNYFNEEGVTPYTSTKSFFREHPDGQFYSERKTFYANGWGTGIGLSFFLGYKYHLMLEFGAGFQDLFIPKSLTKDIVVNNTNFYYNGIPSVIDIILFDGVLFDFNFIYRF